MFQSFWDIDFFYRLQYNIPLATKICVKDELNSNWWTRPTSSCKTFYRSPSKRKTFAKVFDHMLNRQSISIQTSKVRKCIKTSICNWIFFSVQFQIESPKHIKRIVGLDMIPAPFNTVCCIWWARLSFVHSISFC